jgi:hypothetical protein
MKQRPNNLPQLRDGTNVNGFQEDAKLCYTSNVYLETMSTVGLTRVTNLFPELT